MTLTQHQQLRRKTTHYTIIANLGLIFGKRQLLGYAPARYYEGRAGAMEERIYVRVRCECGDESEVPWTALKNGRQQMCRRCAIESSQKRQANARNRSKSRWGQSGTKYRHGSR